MLALLSIPFLLMFFQLYSVQKYFAINMELFSKDFLSWGLSFLFLKENNWIIFWLPSPGQKILKHWSKLLGGLTYTGYQPSNQNEEGRSCNRERKCEFTQNAMTPPDPYTTKLSVSFFCVLYIESLNLSFPEALMWDFCLSDPIMFPPVMTWKVNSHISQQEQTVVVKPYSPQFEWKHN